MTDVELEQIAALAKCSFSPGSTAKAFVRKLVEMPDTYELSDKQTAFLDNLAHQYRKQLGRCMAIACLACEASPHPDQEEIRVALDALLEGREEYGKQLDAWRKLALATYNRQFKTTFAHPYEYATKAKPQHRTAATRGDIYCRFCGERLFVGVKQPHRLVREHDGARRHMLVCALQVLAGMREPASPGHRTLPMEQAWSDELFSTGALFATPVERDEMPPILQQIMAKGSR